MRTEIVTSDDHNRYGLSLREAAAALRDGALVVFPTETVYGVAANAANQAALARLRKVKGRDSGQPFTIHLPRRSEARRYVSAPPPVARRLARKVWPGPLTLLCTVPTPEREEIARAVPPRQLGEIFHAGRVGLRCPAHAMATELLAEAGVPVVASSANRMGHAPPFDVREALRDLGDQVEYAFDGGRTRYNAASTIVEIRDHDWTMRRQGVIDERTIQRMATTEILMVCTGNSCRSPIAEYLFRERLAARMGISVDELTAQGYVISSAGTMGFAGGTISAGSREELAKRNIDAQGHRPQTLTVELIQGSERIYVMADEHRTAVLDLVPAAAERVFMLDERRPVVDPIGGGPEDYEICAAHIEQAVEARLEEFLHEDRNW
jgi:tRNA threonylcarbamoyl adenosine modification protein (Sua5/YciO/YrdC/YwlC family)